MIFSTLTAVGECHELHFPFDRYLNNLVMVTFVGNVLVMVTFVGKVLVMAMFVVKVLVVFGFVVVGWLNASYTCFFISIS